MKYRPVGPQGPVFWLFVAGLCALAGCGSPSANDMIKMVPPVPLEQPAAEEPAEREPQASDTHADEQRAIRQVSAALPIKEGEKEDEKPAKPYDPIEENGKYFVDWPKPKLALVISGRQEGYLEPCGCAGLEQQKGGFSRRHAFLKELEAKGWPLASIDLGGLVRRFGKQAEVQFGISAEALKTMGYRAVGFGSSDLRLSAGDIIAAAAGAKPEDSIFVSANVDLFGLIPKSRIIDAGGLKVGITSVIGKSFQQQVNNAEVKIEPAAEAIKAVLPKLEKCDVRILMAYATNEEAQALALKFPLFQFIITAEGDIPPAQPKKIEGSRARLIEVGHKGMYVVVVGFFDGPKPAVRFQRVALDSRFDDSPDMKQLMVNYQDQLKVMGWDGLGLRFVPHPNTKKGDKLSGQFAGSASCKECHESAFEVWEHSKHAHATDTLAKLDPPRQFDPECISCHATGWNASEFFPFASGFNNLKATAHLVGNGCENCHGPAAAHVAAEKGNNEAQRTPLRDQLHLTWEQAKSETCIKCHDLDNSPEFGKHTEKYWSEIQH